MLLEAYGISTFRRNVLPSIKDGTIVRPDYRGGVKGNVTAQSQDLGRNIGDSFARAHGVTARRTECRYADLFGVFRSISVLYGDKRR